MKLGFLPALLVCLWTPALNTSAQPSEPARQAGDAPRVHDPSTLVRYGDGFWMFCTGRGIRAYHSANLEHWRPAPPLLPVMPGWVRDVVPDHRGHYWAPDIIRGYDRWLLFYSVSSWGQNDSAIALLTATNLGTPDAPATWTESGVVLRSYRTNHFNAIDPAPFRDADGRLWLAFGSFWSGIQLVELDPRTGRRLDDAPPRVLAWKESIEAPFLWRRDTNYFLFVNWGLCCRGTNSTYEIRVGRASQVTGPYLDRDGKDLLRGGGTPVLATEGRFIGPGHAGILRDGDREWFSFHYYDGANLGRPTIAVRRLAWDAGGWPVVARAP